MSSSLFKPNTSQSGIGKKSMDKGQFANPPAFPETSGFYAPSDLKPRNAAIDNLQKSPSAKKGKV